MLSAACSSPVRFGETVVYSGSNPPVDVYGHLTADQARNDIIDVDSQTYDVADRHLVRVLLEEPRTCQVECGAYSADENDRALVSRLRSALCDALGRHGRFAVVTATGADYDLIVGAELTDCYLSSEHRKKDDASGGMLDSIVGKRWRKENATWETVDVEVTVRFITKAGNQISSETAKARLVCVRGEFSDTVGIQAGFNGGNTDRTESIDQKMRPDDRIRKLLADAVTGGLVQHYPFLDQRLWEPAPDPATGRRAVKQSELAALTDGS